MIRSKNLLLQRATSKWRFRELGMPAFAVGASLMAPYALAQTAATPSTELEEVVVSGVREAIKTSQEIKKESDTVVDSITASDIGAFPDKSVAEALQRVPGVFVNRFAASGDTTHFSAEPSGVVIRGLPQVRSEFNGRDTFNANSSRGLSFADVPPELMAGVDTYKNATADMIEGGIAGSVNLRTHVPFDASGFRFAISAKADYGDISDEINPEGSFLISDRWTTGIGDIGLLVNAAYSKVAAASEGVQVGRYYNVQGVTDFGYTGANWVPGGIDVRQDVYDRTRKGGAFAAQWRSPNETVLATLQYNRSDYQNDLTETSLTGSVGNSQSAQDLVLTSAVSRPAAGTDPYEFDSRGVFMRGVMNDSSGSWAGPTDNMALNHENGYDTGTPGLSNWYCYSWNTGCPSTRGISLSADSRFFTTHEITQDTSLNVKWNVSDRLGLSFDLQHVDSTVKNYDNSTDAKTAADVYLDMTGSRPKFDFRLPTGFGFTAGGFSDPLNYYHEWTMEHMEDDDGEEWAGRIDADISIKSGWLDSLRVGYRRAERQQNVNWSTYNWGSVQPLWGIQGDEAFFLTQGRWTNTYETHTTPSSILGGGVFSGGTFVHPLMSMVKNYQTTVDTFAGHSNSWVPLGQRTNCPVVPGTVFCPVEMQDISEDTDAGYIMLKFGDESTNIGGINVRGNIGVRYVVTKVAATGGVQFPIFTPPNPPVPGQPIDPLTLTPADDIAFMNGATTTQSGGGEHESWLPSLNLRFGLTDDMFIRVAASRALARPDMGLYKNYVGIGSSQPTCSSGTVTYNPPGDCTGTPVAYTPQYSASAGNPGLAPTTADQYDLTWEWYFSDTGSVTAALFYKKFNDYLVYGDYLRDFTNNGVTRTVDITGPANGDGAAVQGFEVAYRTFFDMLPSPWNGFGIELNYTYVDNKGVENSSLSSVSGGGTTQQDPLITFTHLPLEGFSKSAYNIIGRYDYKKISARLAYNWRDKFLQTQSDCCIKLPIWQDDYGQLDGSFHYQATDSLDLFFEAQNITNSETVLLQQVNNEGLLLPRSWFEQDVRYQVGVRYSFK